MTVKNMIIPSTICLYGSAMGKNCISQTIKPTTTKTIMIEIIAKIVSIYLFC